MPPVMPRASASGPTISWGEADTMNVSRPARRCISRRVRASGRTLSRSFGRMSGLRATRSAWWLPATAPRMRSRTLSTLSSLAPRHAEGERAGAVPHELAGRQQARRRAATAKANADEPLMSVRSRSKKAARGSTVRRARSSSDRLPVGWPVTTVDLHRGARRMAVPAEADPRRRRAAVEPGIDGLDLDPRRRRRTGRAGPSARPAATAIVAPAARGAAGAVGSARCAAATGRSMRAKVASS